jgi:hypothetical protein
MDIAMFRRFILGTKPNNDIYISRFNIIDLIKKIKPKWSQIEDLKQGSYGPVYTCIIEIKEWGIKLDIVVSQFTEYDGTKYVPSKYVLLVTEGNELRAYFEENESQGKSYDGDCGTSGLLIRSLFIDVHSIYRLNVLKDLGPCAKRTNAAVALFLKGEIE